MGALLLPFTTAQRERLFRNRPPNVGKGLALADWHRLVQYIEAAQQYHVTPWSEHTRAVIAGNANGAAVVADPRPNLQRGKGDAYLTGGHYGVVRYVRPGRGRERIGMP